jgi:hypothetical protein
VLDLPSARTLFESYWGRRKQALVQGSEPLLNMIEAGTARAADEDTCGCGVPIPWGPVLAKSIFLTKQRSFPAYFIAEAVTDIPAGSSNQAWVVLVFRRLSAKESWAVIIDSQQAIFGPETPKQIIAHPVTDAAGFDVSPPTIFPGGTAPLPGDLARYWQYWAANGKAPSSSVFAPGFWTTEEGAVIWQDEKTLGFEPVCGCGDLGGQAGVRDRYVYTPGPTSDAWAVPGPGYEISCGSLVADVSMTKPKGYLTQPQARDELPPGLAPGKYTKVVLTELSSPCFDVPPNGGVSPFGAAPWPVSVVGRAVNP